MDTSPCRYWATLRFTTQRPWRPFHNAQDAAPGALAVPHADRV